MKNIIAILATIFFTTSAATLAFDIDPVKEGGRTCHCPPCPAHLHLFAGRPSASINVDAGTAVLRNVPVTIEGQTFILDMIEFEIIDGTLIPR